MNSQFLTLNMYDMYKSLQMFVITTVLVSIGLVVTEPGFDVFTADLVGILKSAINVAIISTFSYITKNFITNREGVLLKTE